MIRLHDAFLFAIIGLSSCDTNTVCPNEGPSCPSGCDALRATPVDQSCLGPAQVVACIDTADDVQTTDIGCVVRLGDGQLFWTTSGSIVAQLLKLGGWRQCNESERVTWGDCF